MKGVLEVMCVNGESLLRSAATAGLGELRFLHPAGTFALTPASLVSLQAIVDHQRLLSGRGIDWGCGTGCLAIAAARIEGVQTVIGLDLIAVNVETARENARLNGVEDKATFALSDSYAPVAADDRIRLESLAGKIDFIVANPPSSEGDDGFGFRRIVLDGARAVLKHDGIVFLSISFQYGPERVSRLAGEAPGFVHEGVLASTDWVPFDLGRPDLLHCLELYAEEEKRGGLAYVFPDPRAEFPATIDARAALEYFRQTGRSPLTKWQTHLFRYGEQSR